MTYAFWNFSLTGPLVDGLLVGSLFGLLAIVTIWATAEVVKRVFTHRGTGKGNHSGWKDLPKVFLGRHATS